MTALIGASVLLIVGSAIVLVLGWVSADESLIWTSIVASVVAAVTLALAFFRSRVEAAQLSRRTAIETKRAAEAAPLPQEEIEPDDVVGIPDSKRFHRPNCRYAKSKGAQPMRSSEARKLGWKACAVCKP